MFSKGSRYKNLGEIILTDRKDRISRSKVLRWISDISGEFQHTINMTDRMDLLAHKYYENSKKWWRISDANPEFFIPTELINQYPFVREIFIVEPVGIETKWPTLIKDLQGKIGIREVKNDTFESTLDITYNQLETTQQEIINTITNNEFNVTEEGITRKERLGQKITIPPNKVT
jgi:hypothetical protein